MRKSRKEQVPSYEMFPQDPLGNTVNVLNANRVSHILDAGDLKNRIEATLGQEINPEILVQAAANLRRRETQVESLKSRQSRLELCSS